MAKSDKHTELARRALVWLENKATGRGIRGGEEINVKLNDAYIADAVAISGLKLSNLEWLAGEAYRQNCLFGKTKAEKEIKEAVGLVDDYVFVFESKVSRGDFFSTFRDARPVKRMEPVANFHFVVTPPGMLNVDEVPGFWGLLEQKGAGLSLVKKPGYLTLPSFDLLKVAYLVLRHSTYQKFTLHTQTIEKYRKEQKQ